MLGPIFNREVLTIPRNQRFFLSRLSYGTLLLVLIWTGWQIMIGWRTVHGVGILARFEQILFRALVLTQLVLMLFFAPIAAATSIAHEKDRRTFILMLITDLTNWETIHSLTAPSAGLFQFTDPAAPGGSMYYRLRYVP